jgi:hypothetical protein
MIRQFENLSQEEISLLYKAPVLVSVLASGSPNQKDISKSQKADAIKLSHLKSFTAVPVLRPFYEEVEKNFEREFEAAIKKYFPFDDTKLAELRKELDRVSLIIKKLDKKYGDALSLSFERYTKHVKKAAHSIFQDFIFPMPIEGLSYYSG